MAIRNFYHGTVTPFTHIDVSLGRAETDFGPGFYLTNTLSQAERIAVKNAQMKNNWQSRYSQVREAYVYTYRFDTELFSSYNCLIFPIANRMTDEDWLTWINFVLLNRKHNPRGVKRHPYDVVQGPTADDATVVCLDAYFSGLYGTVGSTAAKMTLIRMLEARNLPMQTYIGNQQLAALLDTYRVPTPRRLSVP